MMSFGEALIALEKNKKITRHNIDSKDCPYLKLFKNGNLKQVMFFSYSKFLDGCIGGVVYSFTNEDVFANDWKIIE